MTYGRRCGGVGGEIRCRDGSQVPDLSYWTFAESFRICVIRGVR
jgi:hypothetical protein